MNAANTAILDSGNTATQTSKINIASLNEAQAKLAHDISIATPAMARYFQLKFDHPDCLLFYRMGDFYELFFEDAVTAARILDIALTKRGKHGDIEVSMCGVPVHSHESYLEKLITSGVKVAICEQMEDPAEAKAKRGYKAVVQRDVVRVVTPGTITEDSLLDARSSNYLAAIGTAAGEKTIGWIDLSSGDFGLRKIEPNTKLEDAISYISPRELLLPDTLSTEAPLEIAETAITIQPNSIFNSKRGQELLEETFKLKAIDSLGELSRSDLSTIAALLNYIEITQKGVIPRLNKPRKIASHEWMVIDPATRRNLELSSTLSGSKKGSLLHAIDHTITAGGGRLLSERLTTPLTDKSRINNRLDYVQIFLEQQTLRKEIRETLKSCPDLERAISRICLGRGGPRDLLMIRSSLKTALSLREIFAIENNLDNALIAKIANSINTHDSLMQELESALKTDVPMLARDGGFVADGYHADLDEFRILRDESKRLIANLQQTYAQETGIPSLKIKFNNVLGYFVEITPTHESKITDKFIHRQTMKNALRYSNKELAELEHKMSEASIKALKLELKIFDKLIELSQNQADSLSITARLISSLDVSTALAQLAALQRYNRPNLTNDNDFTINNGRHPVVEQHLEKETKNFIDNNCKLSHESPLWLITGPNMAGKSTFLRQNAIIAIMAQIGSFVPADAANIGIIDKLFSRVGAADDLARGRSTFMVEMVETATILNQATDKSLVILDEIGRGTATHDGLSIAWAVVEHLHDETKCRALFATHYHELTKLEDTLPNLTCHYMKVKEWKGEVIFLHEVGKGAGGRSYGIHVAKLSGLPKSVIKRAEGLLQQLEKENESDPTSLPLFSSAPIESISPDIDSEIIDEISSYRPDEMSPKQAHNALYKLKEMIKLEN